MEERIYSKSNYDLGCRYDSRQSFYGKARVEEFSDGSEVLWSYSTTVACITWENGVRKAHVRGQYSQTTTRHIKEYLKQNGFKADTLKQVLKDYGDDLDETGGEDFSWRIFLLDRGLH